MQVWTSWGNDRILELDLPTAHHHAVSLQCLCHSIQHPQAFLWTAGSSCWKQPLHLRRQLKSEVSSRRPSTRLLYGSTSWTIWLWLRLHLHLAKKTTWQPHRWARSAKLVGTTWGVPVSLLRKWTHVHSTVCPTNSKRKENFHRLSPSLIRMVILWEVCCVPV